MLIIITTTYALFSTYRYFFYLLIKYLRVLISYLFCSSSWKSQTIILA